MKSLLKEVEYPSDSVERAPEPTSSLRYLFSKRDDWIIHFFSILLVDGLVLGFSFFPGFGLIVILVLIIILDIYI